MKKVLKATIRETDDEFHIECRFFDGQKFSAVIIDKAIPGAQNLAMVLANFLQDDIFSRDNLCGKKSDELERLQAESEELKTLLKCRDSQLKDMHEIADKYIHIVNIPELKILALPNQIDSIMAMRGIQLARYKQALEKIEEHFEHRCNLCRGEFELLDCSVCWKKDIKKIINEVKDER